MPKTLILNIDRDDDYGRKAKVKSPIIGIQNNLDAVNKLGRIDPEDSDVNALFLAIRIYDSLRQEGKEVEIVTLCGDMNVGFKADQRLAEQLEMAIVTTGASDAILVSDGAEDEYILPVVQARIKLTSVQRVTVKQSKDLEDAYYRIVKILDDDKVKKQLFLPIALILIVWAIFAVLDMAATGFGAILFTLGIYLLIRTFNSEKKVVQLLKDFKDGLVHGRPVFFTNILAIMIICVSIFYAYTNTLFSQDIPVYVSILSFLLKVTWGVVGAGLLATFGRVADTYVQEKKILWTSWTAPFSLFSFGFIASAIFESLHNSLTNEFTIVTFFSANFIGYIAAGVIIAFIGAISYHYIKETYLSDNQEREVEEQTSKIVESIK